MGNDMKKTYAVALGGIIAALSVVIMFFAAIFPIADLVLPGLAGVLLIASVYEIGEGWSFLIFAAVSLLSLLLPSDKNAAIYYIFFLGHYPIVKSYIERIKNRYAKWAVKFAVFNICSAAAVFVVIKISGMPDNLLKYNFALVAAAYAAIMNVTFIVYDIAVSRLTILYNRKLRKIIGRH